MGKKSKTIALVIILILCTVLLYNTFNANNTNAIPNTTTETPLVVNLLVSWAPTIAIIILYLIFLGQMKQLLEKVERIASAIEKDKIGKITTKEESL